MGPALHRVVRVRNRSTTTTKTVGALALHSAVHGRRGLLHPRGGLRTCCGCGAAPIEIPRTTSCFALPLPHHSVVPAWSLWTCRPHSAVIIFPLDTDWTRPRRVDAHDEDDDEVQYVVVFCCLPPLHSPRYIQSMCMYMPAFPSYERIHTPMAHKPAAGGPVELTVSVSIQFSHSGSGSGVGVGVGSPDPCVVGEQLNGDATAHNGQNFDYLLTAAMVGWSAVLCLQGWLQCRIPFDGPGHWTPCAAAAAPNNQTCFFT